ncbi:RNA polymerase sigma factor [Streptomyces sp. NPDC091281]|uniref:RNA polymerase sigma factor n=1 Tax=Streptomyces sp. NPDC091281 TaxID=3365985 RepID=UPI003826254A
MRGRRAPRAAAQATPVTPDGPRDTLGGEGAGGDIDVPRVRAVLALGGVPWDHLDDGVQEVRLKLLEQRADPARAAVRDPSAWSVVVASRVAADWHRSGQRDGGLRTRLAARWAGQRTTEREDEERTLALAVAAGLARLPARQRQLLTLRYYSDLTVRAIAEVMDIPEGTVKSRLHAAVLALRTQLSETKVIDDDTTD